MSLAIFKKVLQLSDGTSCLNLGGGEPTIHPQFWEFLDLAIASNHSKVWMATNGKRTKITKKLMDLHVDGVIDMQVSRDAWHDPINPEIFDLCREKGISERRVHLISDNGSATKNSVWNTRDCHCASCHVDMFGDVTPCACDNAPKIFNVNDKDITKDAFSCVLNMSKRLGCVVNWAASDLARLKRRVLNDN